MESGDLPAAMSDYKPNSIEVSLPLAAISKEQLARSRSGAGTHPPCICGGHGGYWRRRGR